MHSLDNASFDDDGVTKDDKSNISIKIKWTVIQERFMKVGDIVKLNIKDQLRKISYLETTNLKLPLEPFKTKGAPKRYNRLKVTTP